MSFLTGFKNALSLNDVALLLGYQPKSLSYLLYKYPNAAKYESFEIPKRSGGVRIISAPIPQIKLLQRRLSDALQDCWDEIDQAKGFKRKLSHGFRPGCSIITNASVHRGRRYVFNVDLKDFFPSINFGRVRGYFLKNVDFALPANVATILAQIACHNGTLPQGSPSSPIVSNLIAHILDVRLAQLARMCGCSYSRYADDLTFSTNEETFPKRIGVSNGHLWVAGHDLVKIVQKCGFELNLQKTRMQYRDSRQEVTGLVVNRRINTRSEYRRGVRAMTHRLISTGAFDVAEMQSDAIGVLVLTKVQGTIPCLQGMLGFIDSVDLHVKRAQKKLDGAPSSIQKVYRRFLMHKDFWAASLPTILCEGKTDNVYIRGAIRRLAVAHPNLASINSNGEIDYKIRLYNYSYTTQRILDISGGSAVIKKFVTEHYLKSVAKLTPPKNQQPLIILLDNDSGAKEFYNLIKEYSTPKVYPTGLEDFYHLAANVYIVFTPKVVGDESKIEDFFEPSLLATLLSGKSFNPKNDLDTDTEYGKWVFAKVVVRPNIAKIDFSKFDPILTRLESVIAAQAKKAIP
jgi:RNA-directed DNA polymerase